MESIPTDAGSLAMRRDPGSGQASDTANRLLDAAAAIIVERGIDRLSTTDVGVRAGTSVGTVYRYFQDRDALIATLYDRNVAHMRDALVATAARARGSLAADVRALLDTYVHVHRTLPAYQSVRTWQWLRPAARASRARAVEASARELADVLAPRYGVVLDDDRRARLAEALRHADAIVLAAFLDDPQLGDEAASGLVTTIKATLADAIGGVPPA